MERQNVPNATASLVLGILSILTCLCYGIIGLPLGIIAVVLGSSGLRKFKADPDAYKSPGNATAGRILGFIGILLNLIYLSFIVWVIYKIGWDSFQDPELLQQRLEELLQ